MASVLAFHRRAAAIPLATLLVLAPGSTLAEAPSWSGQGTLGPTLLLRSKSKAVGHLLKPHLMLSFRRALGPRLELGGGITALLDGSEHYRVLGGLALARYALVASAGFSSGPSAGLGLGYDADILHEDLKASSTVAPYGFVGADARWALGPRWRLGVETAWENLSMLRLGVLVSVRWGKETSR